MRCVLDTNVLVSAFLWQGLPARLIELASNGEIRLFTSRALLDELDEVLHRKKLAKAVRLTGFSVDQLVSHYRRLAYPAPPASSLGGSRAIPTTIRFSRARSRPRPISSSPAIETC